MRAIDDTEKQRSHSQGPSASHYADALRRSAEFRQDYMSRLNVVKWQDMPLERSPQGLLKHVINEPLNTKECCIDIYMQFLPPGKASGKHRHLSEEIFFVVEGEGYDLHWDVKFDCLDEYSWEWETTPKRFEWKRGDFVYIPPYCAHQHFNASAGEEARIIVVNSRIIQSIGFDWYEQLENAEGY
jgi:uncharacterized RmlC-like cupin family protein